MAYLTVGSNNITMHHLNVVFNYYCYSVFKSYYIFICSERENSGKWIFASLISNYKYPLINSYIGMFSKEEED